MSGPTTPRGQRDLRRLGRRATAQHLPPWFRLAALAHAARWCEEPVTYEVGEVLDILGHVDPVSNRLVPNPDLLGALLDATSWLTQPRRKGTP
ncbi:hypothetical protein GCM10009593_30400 [Microlunatus antarcticus]